MANNPTDELLKLLRFEILDHRNGGRVACDLLMGDAAAEIERLGRVAEQFDLVPKGMLEIIPSPSAICAVIGCKNREEHPHVVVGSVPDVGAKHE